MVQPATPALSPSAARALPFIAKMVGQGVSSRTMQDTLAAAGLGVRRTELLTAIRQVKGEAQAADRLKYVRKDYSPDPARLPRARTAILRKQSYVVELRGSGPSFGAEGILNVTVSSDHRMTIADIEETAMTYMTDEEVYGTNTLTGALITSARVAGPLGTLL